MATAWMIRNDGETFPVIQHIYANSKEPDETLAAAEWLYQNTGNTNTKKLILETIALWGNEILGANNDNFIPMIHKEINSKPYHFLSIDFIKSIFPKLDMAAVDNMKLHILFEEVKKELNQEFLRARYGGMYYTNHISKEMVFRISSIGFNWYDIIYKFVKNASFRIENITIVRDEESTGIQNGFYRTSMNEAECYNQLPIDVFYREIERSPLAGKNFIINAQHCTGMNQRMMEALKNRQSFRDLRNLPINYGRLNNKLEQLAFKENKLVKEIYCEKNK